MMSELLTHAIIVYFCRHITVKAPAKTTISASSDDMACFRGNIFERMLPFEIGWRNPVGCQKLKIAMDFSNFIGFFICIKTLTHIVQITSTTKIQLYFWLQSSNILTSGWKTYKVLLFACVSCVVVQQLHTFKITTWSLGTTEADRIQALRLTKPPLDLTKEKRKTSIFCRYFVVQFMSLISSCSAD